MIPDSRPMSYSRATITTLVMPHMQNILGDLFGGELMAMVDQAAAVAVRLVLLRTRLDGFSIAGGNGAD